MLKMPFRLRPAPAADADALLVVGGVPDLLAVLARLGAMPAAWRVAGGWVVATPPPNPLPETERGDRQIIASAEGRAHHTQQAEPHREDAHLASAQATLLRLPLSVSGRGLGGGVALRRLAANLYVPADADLLPALLPDEADALTRRRGLVFLPGVVLAFDPAAPARPADLVTVRRLGGGWTPLPEHEPPPPLHEIERVGLPEAVQALLQQAGAGIAAESPGAGSWLGGIASAIGLSALGRMLDTRKQSEALERLLQQFNDGDTDEALRRALPLGGEEARGGELTDNADLPVHPSGGAWWGFGGWGGRVGLWRTDAEMERRLREAYRRAADDAVRRGDFKKAAFIHGKLLGDWSEAARLLTTGGLHDEAAEVWLHRVGDRRLAAGAYAAGGRVERAVALYRELGLHVEAGDLLRKCGEDDRAAAEYRVAAEQHAAGGRYLSAAGLFFRADMPAIADEYLRRGWAARPGADSVTCGERLAERSSPEALLTLLAEAGALFRAHRLDHPAAGFYGKAVSLAERADFAGIRAEVRDRALMTLAYLLRRERHRGGSAAELVSHLLGRHGWPAALVADAHEAARVPPEDPTRERYTDRIRLHQGLVTAVTGCRLTGGVFVGCGDGVLKAYTPQSGRVFEAKLEGPIRELAFESHTRSLFAARGDVVERLSLGPGGLDQIDTLLTDGMGEILGTCESGGGAVLAYREGPDLAIHDEGWGEARQLPDDTWEAILLRSPTTRRPLLVAFTTDTVEVRTLTNTQRVHQMPRPWPNLRCGMLDRPRLAWMLDDRGALQVAGIRDPDRVMAATIPLDGSAAATMHTLPLGRPALAVCWHYPGELAVIHSGGITWARLGQDGCRAVKTTQADLRDAVAAVSNPLTREIWVVFEDGEIGRVPWPS